MRTFHNQSLGSFDAPAGEYDAHQYVRVSFDETRVRGFRFHSVMVNTGNDATGAKYDRLFGLEVEARFAFQACQAFHTTSTEAVRPDGSTFFVTQTWSRDGKAQWFHAGDKFGPVIAEMVLTGYVQEAA